MWYADTYNFSLGYDSKKRLEPLLYFFTSKVRFHFQDITNKQVSDRTLQKVFRNNTEMSYALFLSHTQGESRLGDLFTPVLKCLKSYTAYAIHLRNISEMVAGEKDCVWTSVYARSYIDCIKYSRYTVIIQYSGSSLYQNNYT